MTPASFTTGTLAPDDILAFAAELADAARPLALADFRTPLEGR